MACETLALALSALGQLLVVNLNVFCVMSIRGAWFSFSLRKASFSTKNLSLFCVDLRKRQALFMLEFDFEAHKK